MRFRKRPVEVEAEQYRVGREMPEGVCDDQRCPEPPHVHTIHANQAVFVEDGDWILPEPDGVHHYPVKPDVFAATYEPVSE